ASSAGLAPSASAARTTIIWSLSTSRLASACSRTTSIGSSWCIWATAGPAASRARARKARMGALSAPRNDFEKLEEGLVGRHHAPGEPVVHLLHGPAERARQRLGAADRLQRLARRPRIDGFFCHAPDPAARMLARPA